jgi:outer membrane protein assembly factor BamB
MLILLLGGACCVRPAQGADENLGTQAIVRQLDSSRGICAVVGDREGRQAIALARASELTVYVQLDNAGDVVAARRAAEAAGFLNRRVYVEQGSRARLHLADNLADLVVLLGDALGHTPHAEVLRVLRPGGKGLLGQETITKPMPAGVDQWSHPYHGPDNNPQSTDQVARAPYLTQFLAEPYYGPMPEVTVISGGRMFKAFGSRAFLRPQWPVLNTLMAFNAYNGTLLWQRPLDPDFMIHRNTMIATPDTLYLGDATSCKLLDAATGAVKDEIKVPEDLGDGPVWKWMALEGGVLFALVGEKEPPGDALKGPGFRGAGWPWWKIDQYAWGFGRTIVAIDPASKKILWQHRESDPLDTRAMCLKGERLFFYSHRKFLGCLNTKTGETVWKTSDSAVLDAIGEHHPAQFPATGFATSAYAKCSDDAIYFAGPTRTKLVAVSARDGKLLWQYPQGAFQLVLRDNTLYALGANQPSQKFSPLTGEVLGSLPNRAGCTRATGTVDRIFVRGGGDGTFSWDTSSEKLYPLSPMRPACHDGVIAAGGQLYWGPWMCGCNLSLIGIVCLGPAGDFDYSTRASEAERLEVTAPDSAHVALLEQRADDWSTYRRDNARGARSAKAIPRSTNERWQYRPEATHTCSAPVAVGGLVFVGGSDGVVRALNAANGKLQWKAYTGGMIRVPPAIAAGRAFVGSADGWVYAFEAASGRLLWRFRAAPVERRIPVYGSLSSTWPVASGVLVEEGVAYTAAGIANYDGTHVYALEAATGKIRWQNNTSGNTAGGQGTGASVQGDLLSVGGKLYLAGGNRTPLVSYDLKDGSFETIRPAKFGTDRRGPRGHDLFARADGSVAVANWTPLYTRAEDKHYIEYAELPTGRTVCVVFQNALSMTLPGQGEGGSPKPVWVAKPFQENVAVALAENAIVVAGTNRDSAPPEAAAKETYGIAALDIRNGEQLWRHSLPAGPVAWGLAIDRQGQVLVTLRDGRVVCFGAAQRAEGAPMEPWTFDPATLQRFTEGRKYRDEFETGLYPGGKNEMPQAHRQAGERIAATIRPLDVAGAVDEQNGRILALVLGHSNCSMYFGALQRYLAQQRDRLHPRFELMNAAVGGQQLPEIVALRGGVWDRAQSLLDSRPGYSRQQVQVLFLHTTYHGASNGRRLPPRPFPEVMQNMQRDLDKVLAYCVERFPNLKIAYLTCDGFRHFTGFEPHVYQEAFALKWLIESQLRGEASTRFEGPERRLPWLTWGPYIWDHTWDRSYFTDGVHPAPKALEIFVDKYWQHLARDTVARPWLLAPAVSP